MDRDKVAPWVLPCIMGVLVLVSILVAVSFCCCMRKFPNNFGQEIEFYTNIELHVPAEQTENTEV